MLIAVGTAVSSLTDGRRNRVGHENHPVQIVITLLYVLQHSHSLVQPAGEDVVLRLQFAVLLRNSFSDGEPKISSNTMKLPAPSPIPMNKRRRMLSARCLTVG